MWRRWQSLEVLAQNVRDAVRAMRRSPGFTAIAVVSLALGSGANTAVFSLVNLLMLRPLPVAAPSELVELESQYPGEAAQENAFSWAFYEHVRDGSHSFASLIGTSSARFQLAGNGMADQTLDGEYVAGPFFQALGVRAALGRVIPSNNDALTGSDAAIAVLSWSVWQGRFNGDPAVVGRRLTLGATPVTIVGVADRLFTGLEVGSMPDLWVPAALDPTLRQAGRRANGQMALFAMKLMGRLKPGTTLDRAQAEASVLNEWRVDQIATSMHDPQWRQARLEVRPAASGFSTLRNSYGRPLLAVMVIVAALLLLACTNIASMLLARGAARRRELAVRVSLGASRARLLAHTMTESLLLSAIGCALGALVAVAGANALVRIIASGRQIIGLPARLQINVELDLRVLLFTLGVAIAAAVLFGAAPAWHAMATEPAGPMREGGTTDSVWRRRFGGGLVVAQVALSTMLLTAATMLVDHLYNLRSVDLGFTREGLLLVSLDPRGSLYTPTQLTARFQELLGRLERIPGVRSATLSGVTPIQGAGAARFASVEGFSERPEDRRYLSLNWVAPKYFATLGTPLLAGRDFDIADAGRARVAIVNEAMVRRYFPGRSAIGRHLVFDGDDKPYEIVGVAGDAKYLNLHRPPPPTVYLNSFQEAGASQFAIRTTAPPLSIADGVRRAVREVASGVRVAKVTTMEDQVDASIVPERLIAVLSECFGAIGALLAAVGLYGLLAYTIARRTTEIGIRMALGASPRDVARLVFRSALTLVLAGLLVGAPAAFVSRRALAALVDDLTAGAATPIALAAATLIGVAVAAAFVPARRAARVQPIDALRHQ